MTGVFNVKKLTIWHAVAPIYGASTVIIMDILPWTAWIRYHCQAHQHATQVTPPLGIIGHPLGIIVTPDILAMIIKISPGLVIPDPIHIPMDIGVAAVMAPIGDTPGHSTDLPNVVSHAIEAQVPTTIVITHCTGRSSSCRNLSQDDSRSRHKSPKATLHTGTKILFKLISNTLEA